MKIGLTTLRNVGNSYYIYVGKKIADAVNFLVGKEFVIMWEEGKDAKLVVADVGTYNKYIRKLFSLG